MDIIGIIFITIVLVGLVWFVPALARHLHQESLKIDEILRDEMSKTNTNRSLLRQITEMEELQHERCIAINNFKHERERLMMHIVVLEAQRLASSVEHDALWSAYTTLQDQYSTALEREADRELESGFLSLIRDF